MIDGMRLLIISCGVCVVILGGLFFGGVLSYDLNGDRTDCYDGYNNRIEGQKCIVENSFNSEVERFIGALLLGGFFWAIGCFVILTGMRWD